MTTSNGRGAPLYRLYKEFYDASKKDDNDEVQELVKDIMLSVIGFLNGVAGQASRLQYQYTSYLVEECGSSRGCVYSLVVLDARLVYRGRFGGGGAVPPFESGVFLHPVFLVPFIPGSSIKGVLRAALRDYLSRRGIGGRGLEQCVWAVFGSTEDPFAGIGGVVVFDAYPVGWGVEGVVVGDIVTPHYRGVEETELDASPVPARVLSVGEGTVFRIVVGVDEEYVAERAAFAGEDCASAVGRPLHLLASLLVHGLEQMGVGGKTTRGYGRLELKALRLVAASSSRARCRR